MWGWVEGGGRSSSRTANSVSNPSLLPLCAQQRRGVSGLEEEEYDEQSLVVSCIQTNNRLIQLIDSRASSLTSQPPLQGSGSSAHPASPPSDHNGSCTSSFLRLFSSLPPSLLSLALFLFLSVFVCSVSRVPWFGGPCVAITSCSFVQC